jgi:hypothetical protein
MCQNNGTLGALSDSWLMNVYSPNYGNFTGFDPSENFSVESCTGASAPHNGASDSILAAASVPASVPPRHRFRLQKWG